MGNELHWNESDLEKLGYQLQSDGTYKRPTTPQSRVPAEVKHPKAEKPIIPSEEKPINKKIRNATPSITQDGTPTDSKLEAFMYNLLKMHKIEFEFQKEYLLQESFLYNGKRVRPITLTVDFYLESLNTIIDSKGWANDVAPLKYKLLKWVLWEKDNGPEIYLPKNKSECEALINRLLSIK